MVAVKVSVVTPAGVTGEAVKRQLTGGSICARLRCGSPSNSHKPSRKIVCFLIVPLISVEDLDQLSREGIAAQVFGHDAALRVEQEVLRDGGNGVALCYLRVETA